MSSLIITLLLAIFYFIILFFATSDLKQFIFHVHISRVDRVPVTIDIDSSDSLWYPISIGIIFNVFIWLLSIVNLYILLGQKKWIRLLFTATLILVLLFTIRFIINIILTKSRNGFSTPTLVERSFFAPSLSLEEELTTLTLNYLIKFIGFIGTFLFCYRQKQEETMSVERRRETKLMSSFD